MPAAFDLVWYLVKTEYASKYAGSFLGLAWSLITPILFSCVVWFVFEMGFKVAPMDGVPFIVYFLTGYVVFITFSDSVNSSVNSIVSKPHLVKNTIFPLHYLFVVSIAANFLQHVALFLMICVVAYFHGFPAGPSIMIVLYGVICLVVFSFSIGLIVGTLNVFFKDVGHLSTVILNIWFWATPIIWSENFVPSNYELLLTLNPLKHVIDVYRLGVLGDNNTVIFSFAGFVVFWLITGFMFFIGFHLLSRSKPMFANNI